MWIHTGIHRAEAGFLDPSLGWIGVRADAVGSTVHAALMPGTAEGAQMLASHLAGLNAHLSEHQGPSTTVTMAITSGEVGAGISSGSQSETGTGARETAQPWRDEAHVAASLAPAAPSAMGATLVNASTGTARYISVIA
jgi:hypothetical protein